MGGSTSKEACSRWRVRDEGNGMSDWVDVCGESEPLAP